jgi:hypothetical protein
VIEELLSAIVQAVTLFGVSNVFDHLCQLGSVHLETNLHDLGLVVQELQGSFSYSRVT